MTYTPDITRYQQLLYGGATRGVDCTAWGGALVTDAHTQGKTKLSGRSIRLASNEPVPDPSSPGLNVGQVDAAIYKLTNGRVNLNTIDPRNIGRAGLRERVVEGRWVNLAIRRSVIVARGYGGSSYFQGAHDITVHCRPGDPTPIIGDPLVPYYIRTTWDTILDAAQAVTPSGLLFCSFTRDLIPLYKASILPPDGETRSFWVYTVQDNRITGRHLDKTAGIPPTACTAPRYFPGPNARQLVRFQAGSRKNKYIDARHARPV